MLKKALEVLRKLEDNGYNAYIVGGFVRDYFLGNNSADIDICTNAKPKDIIDLFEVKEIPDAQYGSVKVVYKNVHFEITTFRVEMKYENNRRPVKIKYIDDIKIDLLRRDFTINTLCMDKEGRVLDILYATPDLNKRIIRTVGNPRYKLKEDALRILRAIRFATTLNFEIDPKTKYYLKKYGKILKKISYNRKREELDKIFSSQNREYGIKLLLELKLDKHLELTNLNDIRPVDNVIGIWAQLNNNDKYPFSKLEKEQIINIKTLLDIDVYNNYIIYKYGLYLMTIIYDIKKLDKKNLNMIYSNLPIRSINDINIKPIEISNILKEDPGKYLKNIIVDLEKAIINGEVSNDYDSLKKYIIKNYK